MLLMRVSFFSESHYKEVKGSSTFTLLGKTGIAEECLGASGGYKDILTRVNIEMANRRPRGEQVGQNKLLSRKQLLSWK